MLSRLLVTRHLSRRRNSPHAFPQNSLRSTLLAPWTHCCIHARVWGSQSLRAVPDRGKTLARRRENDGQRLHAIVIRWIFTWMAMSCGPGFGLAGFSHQASPARPRLILQLFLVVIQAIEWTSVSELVYPCRGEESSFIALQWVNFDNGDRQLPIHGLEHLPLQSFLVFLLH